ncbi:3 TM domain-containing transmembrane protein [Acrasis kona]|uniref:3 TM domain-containing transmembrane protein n=1 Tax=Acrasis kona TaxID=1008807 RepID=A0AAW2ZR05_9EUKA
MSLRSVDNIFGVFATISVASLLTTVYIHSVFNTKIAPHILYYCFLLDETIQKNFYKIRLRYKIVAKLVKYHLFTLAMYLKWKKPSVYFKLLLLYYKLLTFSSVPTKGIKNILWFAAFLYVNILWLSMYILQKIAPGLSIFMKRSWSDVYRTSERVIRYLSETIG